MKEYKSIIFLLLIIIEVVASKCQAVEREQPLDISEFGFFAETLAKELPAAMSLEEYEAKETRVKNIMHKRRLAKHYSEAFSNLSATLFLISQMRERLRRFELYKAEILARPIRACGPRKAVHADGSVTYSGTNTTIAKFILKKYGPRFNNIEADDIKEIMTKLENTEGRKAHKRFSITFGAKQEDKLGNTVKIPFSLTLTNEINFFPEFTFSKSLSPKFAQDENGNAMVIDELSYTFTKYDPSKFHGEWYAFNNKETNAFGYSTGYTQTIINKTLGIVTVIDQRILEYDLKHRREPWKYERKITEYDLASQGKKYCHSYEEIVEITKFYDTFDNEGKPRYLPQEMIVIRFNDDQKKDVVTKSYVFQHYDQYDRVDRSVIVTNEYSKDGRLNYNTITITDNSIFDPLTGLSIVKYDKVETMPFQGDFELAKEYGRNVWRALQDDDLRQFEGEIENICRLAFDIASLVVWGAYDYELAKELTLKRYQREKVLSKVDQNWLK